MIPSDGELYSFFWLYAQDNSEARLIAGMFEQIVNGER